MSRLDWFTIVIVGVCMICLGFLVYKTIQLMGNDQSEKPRSEVRQAEDRNEHESAYEAAADRRTDDTVPPDADDQDLDDDELPYDPKEVEAPETEQPVAERSTPKPASSTPETSKPATSQPKTTKPVNTAPAAGASREVTTSRSSTGDFMVVAGSFSMRYNAESQVKRLKSLGYDNARVEIFNGGALATALVDRFDDYDRAKRLVDELKSKGVDAFVKRKQ